MQSHPLVSAWLRAWHRRRRGLLAAGLLAFAGLASPAFAQPGGDTPQWVATWGTAPAEAPASGQASIFKDQTVRLIVHTSIGGSAVRIRIANTFGALPLRIGEARIALRRDGATIAAGSDRALSFGGERAVTVAPGGVAVSDPVDLDVPARSDLAVSLHLPGSVQAATIHDAAFQRNYVSKPGNFTAATTFPTDRTITFWPFLTDVDVDAPGAAAIVALGDSITDGSNTMADANHRWPDLLALRLQAARGPLAMVKGGKGAERPGGAPAGPEVRLGIVNRGIAGNRLLRDPGEWQLFGRAALERFDRDVLATAGVRHLVVFIGINDIGHPGTGTIPASEEPTPDELVAGYRRLIARAREKGIAIYGATLTPFEGTTFPGYYTPAKEQVRQAVNHWIRSSGEFDGVIDFDRALRDPGRPSRLLPAYDSGDHLHPNDRGMQAMADAVPLQWFRSPGSSIGASGTTARTGGH
jgi:lysophospholipase L1-like esterase